MYQEPSSTMLFRTEFNNHTLNYTNTALNLTVCLPYKKASASSKAYILCFCIIAQLYYIAFFVTTTIVF